MVVREKEAMHHTLSKPKINRNKTKKKKKMEKEKRKKKENKINPSPSFTNMTIHVWRCIFFFLYKERISVYILLLGHGL